ncbi:RNA polymerase II-associated protein 3-like [Ctenocephalides felis]|uniref:RNA polymerase II-associated protein 3-like n=1 Tax=Ctenocephalides felis TaxID=7515 RepID=UPI000E6E5303|nr:RNA polymerase II-associated protein 3-like [Ctenocephalides felis]
MSKITPSMQMQLDMRNNSTVLEDYARELYAWEKEMKEKDKFLQKPASKQEEDLPPPRSKRIKTPVAETTKKSASTDYNKWDKFDVEKACEEVDYSTESESSDDEEAINKSKELKNEGNTFVKMSNWTKALECYTKAIQLYQGDAIYYANRALCYLKLEKWAKAEKDCCRALEIDPKYVKALQRRSVARAAVGKLNMAIKDMSEVLNLEPNNQEAKEHLLELNNKIRNISKTLKSDNVKTTEIDKQHVNNETKKDNKKVAIVKVHNWFTESDKGRALVKPIFKAPHERSKKPLRRIHIDEETEITKSTKRSINTLNNVSKIPDTNISANSSVLTETLNSNPISKYKEQFKESIQEEKPKEIVQLVSKVPKDDVKSDAILNIRLEEPKSSIHFYNVWKQLKGNPEKKYEFLKIIDGKNFKKLFGSSLESNILSEILQILKVHFISNNESVLGYLEGLKNVERFNALKMFMSSEDKDAIKSLLLHSEKVGEITQKELENMLTTYEIK